MSCKLFESSKSVFKKPTHQEYDILNDLRLEGLFCDSIIRVKDGVEFPIHRAILAATSCYFRALFIHNLNISSTPSLNNRIFIGGIDSETMRYLIEWAYTRNISITVSNVERIFIAADQFEQLDLKLKCAEFIEKNLNYENVIGVRRLANTHDCKTLRNSAFNYLMEHFVEVAEYSQEFLEIDFVELREIITADELNVKYEENVFEAVIRWIESDNHNRINYVSKLLTSLRLGLISKDFIVNKLIKHSFLSKLSDCKALLMKQLQKNSANPLQYIVTRDESIKPRIPHELLIVIGGWSSGQVTGSIEIFDCRANTWVDYDDLSDGPRAYHGIVSLNDKIYLIGGFDGKEYHNTCRTFDLVNRRWNKVASMNMKRCYVSVTHLDGIIYAFGGFDGISRQKTSEKYEKNQWIMIAHMQHARSDASATACNGKIYVCGGFNGQEYLDSTECYDPNCNVWTLISKMNFKRSGTGLINYFGSVYALGGFNGELRLATVEKYDARKDEWFQIEDMNTSRSNFAVQIYNDSIVVMGGFNGITTVNKVESYSLTENKWKAMPRMKIDRSAVAATVIKNIDYTKSLSALNFISKSN